jgi:putative transposase
MANTYSQVYLHFVFTVRGRQNMIPIRHREELHKYITGIVHNRNQKMLAINSMPDHLHMLVGFNTTMSIADFMEQVKSVSSKFINEKGRITGKFAWQRGYGVFSYSQSQMKNMINYILYQQEHHRQRSFREEYLMFLKEFEIDYIEKYLFEWIE